MATAAVKAPEPAQVIGIDTPTSRWYKIVHGPLFEMNPWSETRS
jgi:hypothetical protein